MQWVKFDTRIIPRKGPRKSWLYLHRNYTLRWGIPVGIVGLVLIKGRGCVRRQSD